MSKKSNSSKKNTRPEGLLPKMELLIIFVFFLSFILWAMSKCNSTQSQYEKAAANEEQPLEAVDNGKPKNKIKEVEASNSPQKSTNTASRTEKVTVLYVTLSGLNMRRGPHLDSSIVRSLKVDSEVYFLNEVSNFKQKINLGDRVAVEPWVKVRAYSGHEGWVYGAGVSYFKSPASLDTLIRQ